MIPMRSFSKVVQEAIGSRKLIGWLRIAGVLLLVAGAQAWLFSSQTSALLRAADVQLASLREELSGDRMLNSALRALQDYWRATNDELRKREILALRDTVLEDVGPDRVAAVRELVRIVRTFEPTTDDEAVVARLRRETERLESLYTDRAGEALRAFTRPAWYLQPTASFLNNDRANLDVLEFNHALYFMFVGDSSAASEILQELRREASADARSGRVLFALSRLSYDAYLAEKDPHHFRESLDLARESVHHDPASGLPKLFLEYLLSLDRSVIEVNSDTLEGLGSGEGQGERGSISNESGEF